MISSGDLLQPPPLQEEVGREKEKGYLPHIEYRVDVRGTEVHYAVYDFREGEGQGEMKFFFDGFGQSADISLLMAALIDKSRTEKGLLIMPRIPGIPPLRDEKTPEGQEVDSSIDSRIIMDGIYEESKLEVNVEGEWQSTSGSIEQDLAAKGINCSLAENDINIAGYSDGNRKAIWVAGEVEKRGGEITNHNRTLELWSQTGIVDMTPGVATGREFLLGFAKEVAKIGVGETIARFNAKIEETDSPLLKYGMTKIQHTSGMLGIGEMVARVVQMQTFKDGRRIFMEQLGEEGETNLKFLWEVTERALMADKNYQKGSFKGVEKLNTLEKLGLAVKFVKALAAAEVPLMKQLSKNEKRSPVCDELKSFIVKLRWPQKDTIFPDKALGRTIKDLAKSAAMRNVDLGNWDFLRGAFTDQQLGWYAMNMAPDDERARLGRLLFPKAKGVQFNVVAAENEGKFQAASHVGPLAFPERFIGQ